MYTIIISPKAQQDLQMLKKSEPQAYKKARLLIEELSEHPKTGTGKPQLKKYNLSGFYSRRISQKHRLVYQILEEKVAVLMLTAHGHYGDK
jgi:toxin YoeB